jgi:hypothetical protein
MALAGQLVTLTGIMMNSVQNEFLVSKRRALTEMYDQILRFTPCRPPETRGDSHMLILLCDPLMNESWAEDTSSLRLMDGSTTLATTYVKLAAILTDKLQKGSASYSFQDGSPAMAYHVNFDQRLAHPPRRLTGNEPSASWRDNISPRRPSRSTLPTDTCLRCKGI